TSFFHFSPPSTVPLFIIIFFHLHLLSSFFFFFFNDTATTEIYTPFPTRRSSDLKEILHTLRTKPLSPPAPNGLVFSGTPPGGERSEEHTSELQSQSNLVCRLLLEKKKKKKKNKNRIKKKKKKMKNNKENDSDL